MFKWFKKNTATQPEDNTAKKPKMGRLLGGIFLFSLGIFASVGFSVTLEHTNTTEFCVSCHTMQGNYQELQQTLHWSNVSGVSASCADCHVPEAFLPKMQAKAIAVKDVWHELIGTVDTPEKFEARRWEMANRVWDRMRASDSQECRHCHSFEHMDFEKQDRFASRKHERATEREQTCIDCHQGIAHKMPEEPKDQVAQN